MSETALGLTAVFGSTLLLAIAAGIACAAVAEFAPDCSLARKLSLMGRLIGKTGIENMGEEPNKESRL